MLICNQATRSQSPDWEREFLCLSGYKKIMPMNIKFSLSVLFTLLYLIIIIGDSKGKNNLLIVALGDSLTAGYGVEESLSFPGRLQKRLEEKGLPHRVVNAGVSGDTTAGGLRRIHGILKQKPDIVILALGSNDGLRGFPPAEIKKNLEAIIKICLENKTMVLLAGMKIPPNYGPKYTGEFKAIYPRLAKRYDLFFIPFLLEGVAGKRGLNQSDGIHPKAEGYAIVTELVWQALLSMLE